MNLIHTINQHYAEDFGRMIRIHRVLKHLTLRDLANLTNFSHTLLNKIETGQNPITPQSYERILKALNIEFTNHEDKNAQFKQHEITLEQAALHADIPTIISIMEALESEKAYYMHSINITDYLVLLIGVTNNPLINNQDKVIYVDALYHVETLMSPNQRQKLNMNRGLYHYHQKHFKSAIKDFLEAIEINPQRHQNPMIKHFLAKAYNDDYQLVMARRYFKEAIQDFEQTYNLARAMYSKLYLAIINLKMHNYKEAGKTLQEVQSYAENTQRKDMIDLAVMHRMLLSLMQQNYEAVFIIGQGAIRRTNQYYFYHGYAAYCLDMIDEVRQALNNLVLSKPEMSVMDRFYETGMKCLEALVNKDKISEEDLGKQLKTFFETTLVEKAYVEATFVYDYYRDYLISRRQYKKAYELSETMRHISYEAMY